MSLLKVNMKLNFIDLYVYISKAEKLNTAVDFAARGFHIR